MQDPYPTECEHPDCKNEPIVGVNDHYVCKEHLDWVFEEHVPNPRKFLEELTDGR